MEVHLHHFNMRRYEGYDQAVADEDGGTLTIAALFKVSLRNVFYSQFRNCS